MKKAKDAGGKRVTLFPVRPKSKKRLPTVGFRPPEDVFHYLKALEERGYTATEVVVEMIRLAKDAEEGADQHFEQIRELARVEGVSVGVMLGRLAAKAIADTKRKK